MAEVFVSHLEWSGAAAGPTRDPATFSRDLDVAIGAISLPMSAAAGFRGNPDRLNPEQLFVASLSACQALTYLYLAARRGVAVIAYSDDAEGRLGVVDGRMRMSRVTLRPHIVLERPEDEATARQLVSSAHHDCFIASSVASSVEVEATFAGSTASASGAE